MIERFAALFRTKFRFESVLPVGPITAVVSFPLELGGASGYAVA